MSRGTVRWFSEEKGYGFISPDDEGREEVFVDDKNYAMMGKSGVAQIIPFALELQSLHTNYERVAN